MHGPLALVGLVLSITTLSAVSRLAHDGVLARRPPAADIAAFVTKPTPGAARLVSLAHNELLADLFWIRTLVYYGDGLVAEHGMPDVESLILLINRLDPHFRKPYQWGSFASTFREDGPATQAEYRSSVEILRRGLEVFPRDWELNWLLGLRLFLDLKPADPAERKKLQDEGAMYIERAMRLPRAPSDLPILAASLRTKLGQKDRALRALREMILITEDPKARERLERQYAGLASESAADELAAHARELDSAWKRDLPYVPRTTYLILGPPPPRVMDLDTILGGGVFQDTIDGDD
jgi:hypothetical protein